MGGFSITHWLILLAVVVLVFGTSKFRSAGKDLGSAIKGFKDAMKEGDNKTDARLEKPADTIEGQAKRTDQEHKV